MSELAKVIDSCILVKSQSPLAKQFSKTSFLSTLEKELIAEVNSDCNSQMEASSSETAKNKLPKKKLRSRLRTNTSFKGESALELIKEDITDPERSSPVERLNTGNIEQHRRSPRRMHRRTTTSSDSDDDDDDVIKEQPLLSETRIPPGPRKRNRTVKSRLMALHKQTMEDYDGDYEDEIPTPASVSFDSADKVFEYAATNRPTTSVEVHNLLKKSRSSDSSVEMSNDSTCLIPERATTTSSTRKLSIDRHSVSSPSITFSNLMDPLRNGGSSLKQLKVALLKGHSSSYYESTV